MSRRAEIEQRQRRLAEVSEIMAAMKTLALIETHKFSRFMGHQQQLVRSIEAAAADFLAFYPAFGDASPGGGGETEVLILVGSERGFCGDFNDLVAARLGQLPSPLPRLVAVGRRLAAKLEGHPRLMAWLDGPNVAEEVQGILDRLVNELHRLQTEATPWTHLNVLAHDSDGNLAVDAILPLRPAARPAFSQPPYLTLAPSEFFAGLADHYLSAKLPCLFHASLMAENRRRLEHMERALHRMDEKMEELGRRRNVLRQEEIVEEIEVILLSAESLLGEA